MEKEIQTRQTPENALEFTLRLANAPITAEMSDSEAVDAIYNQFKRAEAEKYFPEFFHMIDPDNFCSETKLLDDSAKQRLRVAVEKYSDEVRAR